MFASSSSIATTSKVTLRCHRQFHSSARRLAKGANHYETLSLPKTATRQQIKAQFYRLSKEYHPDAKPGHEAKFQAISEAYATLGNAEARKVYDTTMTSTSSYHPNRHHTSSPSSHYHPDYAQHSDNEARRARAGYAWEHTRRTNPRHQTGAHTRYNPFTAHHAKQQDHTAHQNHNAHFDRMQAREAWRMSNMSSGARRRAEFESAQMAKEEDLRNTSSFSRAFQFVAMFMGVLWVGGTLRAGAWEKEHEEDVLRYLGERKALQAEEAKPERE